MSETSPHRKKLEQRATNLDTLFSHLEKTVVDLDDVVIDGKKKIEELSDRVDHLEKKIHSQKHDFPDEIRDLL
ncbi:MAG: SlyX family protein [Planctomycetota bacterium]|nr:SlyX family protein [Planctomycetota bacterium]